MNKKKDTQPCKRAGGAVGAPHTCAAHPGHRHRPARRRRRPTGRDAGRPSCPVASGRVRSRPVASGRVPRPRCDRGTVYRAHVRFQVHARDTDRTAARRGVYCAFPSTRIGIGQSDPHWGSHDRTRRRARCRSGSPRSLPWAHFVSVSPAGFPTSIAALATVSAASASLHEHLQ